MRLKMYEGEYGYFVVGLIRDRKLFIRSVHQLVLEAFVGPRPKGRERYEARHFPDRDPANNKLSNLGWSTQSVNQRDRVFHGTDTRGEGCGMAKLAWKKVREIRRLYLTGKYTHKKLGKLFCVNESTVGDIIRGRTWKPEWDPERIR